ncbi:MAG: hypothetical protein SGPRY_007581, partial [Prymnesium sp.]
AMACPSDAALVGKFRRIFLHGGSDSSPAAGALVTHLLSPGNYTPLPQASPPPAPPNIEVMHSDRGAHRVAGVAGSRDVPRNARTTRRAKPAPPAPAPCVSDARAVVQKTVAQPITLHPKPVVPIPASQSHSELSHGHTTPTTAYDELNRKCR